MNAVHIMGMEAIRTLRNGLEMANVRSEAQLRGLATLPISAQRICQAVATLHVAQANT